MAPRSMVLYRWFVLSSFGDESKGGNAYAIHRFAQFATGRDESDNNVKRDFKV